MKIDYKHPELAVWNSGGIAGQAHSLRGSSQMVRYEFMRIFGRKPFAMTENVAPLPLYYPEAADPEGEVRETREARVRHFQQHSKDTGKDGFLGL